MPTSYKSALEHYAALGVDTEAALKSLEAVPISLHCWQGDDVGGFEKADATLSGGGIQATGNYPGKARTIAQLQQDLDMALSLIPGKHRLNLHACYADLGGKNIDRDGYSAEHFQGWISWCKDRGMGMDFNPSYFSHPLADRKSPRERLAASLDEIFAVPVDRSLNLDAVESKLFGIGSESYVVGSHEFYLAYAVKNRLLYCLDAGHFHPTENLADKVSSILQFVPELLLHVSRGVRWDSDHVVLFDDPTRAIMEELVRGGFLGRTHIGLDFFDASINRIAAWVIGTRGALKSLLAALLEPATLLREAEQAGDNTLRLALFEEAKTLPLGAVWDEYCRRKDVPGGARWMDEVKRYEKSFLSGR